MGTIFFMVAGATISFCVGVLVGSGLHTRSVEQQYRRLAQLVESLNELKSVRDRQPAEYWVDPAGDYYPPRVEEFGVLPPRT